MSNYLHGDMRLSLSARMMRALEDHFEVDAASGALALDPTLLGLVGLNADGTWVDTSAVHASTSLLDLAGKLKAATDQEAQYRTNADTAATTDRAAIRSEFAAADVVLDGKITAEKNRAEGAEGVLQGKIDDEEAARILADNSATTDRAAIRSEFAAADAAIVNGASVGYDTLKGLEDYLKAEVARAVAAEGDIQADVDQNEADGDADRALIRSEFAAADSDIQAELDASQTGAGLAADGSYVATAGKQYISGALSLVDADNKLDDAIKAEKLRAEGVEATLQSNIDVETARIDAILLGSQADKDSFAEIVTLINSVDTENDQAFAAYVLSNDAALAQEVTDRGAGDQAIQDELDATQTGAGLEADGTYTANGSANYIPLATSLVDADNKLDAQIKVVVDNLAAEIVNRAADVDAEEARALAAEGVLQGKIDDEEAARILADNSATTDRAAIRSEFAAADATLQGNIDAEAATRLAADNSATTDRAAIRSEFAAADVVLDGKITAEKNRAEGVEGDLANINGNLDNTNLVAAINSLYGSSGGRFDELSAEHRITDSRHYPMQVDANVNGFSHVSSGMFGQNVTLADVLTKAPVVGQDFPEFEPNAADDSERAAKIYSLVRDSVKVFVNGMFVPMLRDPVTGDFVMGDVADAHEFKFSADGTKVLAPSGFSVAPGEFAVIMLG